MPVTYYVVVPFGRDEDGNLAPLEAIEAPHADAARRRAKAAADQFGGAIAFSRTGDPASGDFTDTVVLAVYGEVDAGMLGE